MNESFFRSSHATRNLGGIMKKCMTAVVVCFLIILQLNAQQSENQLDIHVNPDSWSGFYIHATGGATILIDINVTSVGEAYLLIVDEGEFEDYRVNGTSFHNFESHHFVENLTLSFVVPHTATWYFLFWNIGGQTLGYAVYGVVIPSPDGYVGDNSKYLTTALVNVILAIAVIVPIAGFVYLIIRKPKPSTASTG